MTEHRMSLDGQWKRLIDGRAVDFVTVPGSYPPAGQYTLERQFTLPWPARPGERIFLCTEGVLSSAQFVVNGQPVGQAEAFVPFRFELPRALLKADNVIEAHLRDVVDKWGPQLGRKFHGGLIREIYLERRPAAFIEQVAFRPGFNADCSAADCQVEVTIDGAFEGKVQARLAERDSGRVVAAAESSGGQPIRFRLEAPRLWSPERPDLYTLTVRLAGAGGDEVEEMVGFRRAEVRGRDFFLNNRRVVLKGVCRHEFTEAQGYSPDSQHVRRELARIRRAGFNFVRLVHSPQAPCVSRIAAELGLLVSEEPGVCFQNLADPLIADPSIESLRRLVLRDRNVPSVFAWLIYNECNPHPPYAVRAAATCRELDPGCLVAMADCSGQNDTIKAMAAGAGLSFYGINAYGFDSATYTERMEVFQDRPLVFTEWGGWWGQGNERALRALCNTFAEHSRQAPAGATPARRIAGCCFWAWADYEERTRGGPAAPDGFTIEGLVDVDGRPKPDLLTLSQMSFEMDYPAPPPRPRVEILAQSPLRLGAWQCVSLDEIDHDQVQIEQQIDAQRAGFADRVPIFGRLIAGGIEFRCRRGAGHPLLIGPGREEVVIPVGRIVREVAFLGQVAFKGGYPPQDVWPAGPGAFPERFGVPASEYEFVFDEQTVVEPQKHGIHVLRANDICGPWTTAPRGPLTTPALHVVLDVSKETLRYDLWEVRFPQPRRLECIRWRLRDANSIQGLLAVSVME